MKKALMILLCAAGISACQSNDIAAGEACGKVSVFFVPPEVNDVYPASIDNIDGRNVVAKGAYSLTVGPHKLKIYERISDPRLKVPAINRGYSQVLEINVEANKRYNIGARFVTDKRFSLQNDYWQPVVWRVDDEVCE